MRKEEGCLGEFNVALLGNWCWMMLVDRGGLWYDVEGGHVTEGAKEGRVGGRCNTPLFQTIK